MNNPSSLRKTKKKFQLSHLEIDFLTDSGAESNFINIPTWNGIQILHPKLFPLKTSSKLATSQGAGLKNYGKIQLLLSPIQTRGQKIFFKQTVQTNTPYH